MLPPIPCPEDYDVSSENGFLPDQLPLQTLPHPYYGKWEAIVANLQALLLSKRLRAVINDLPVITTSRLKTAAELRRAYVLLSFMSHAYIWGDDVPAEVRLLDVNERRPLLIGFSEYPLPSRFPLSKSASIWSYPPLPPMPASVFGTGSRSFQMNQSIHFPTSPHSPPLRVRLMNHGFIWSPSRWRLAADPPFR